MRTNDKDKIELLAPAGSLDICKAVINAGADAVYLGGKSFSARAYAGNLSTDEIIRALDYAHLRGAKIYLTLNTLIKERELSEIPEFLAPLYEAGLDAVIVQDLGLLQTIRECFPKLSVHASTQMAVMTTFFASYLKELGVKRIVLPREMTLQEISEIQKETSMELEVFVHGALCYSYSGLCLFSSMHGTRSGNRGSCAQPCRLPYTASGERNHLLCTKDICALETLPDIIKSGAVSLKIEGRMKNVYYAAGVTSIYRKYIDACLEAAHGGKQYSVDEQDVRALASLYNRGGFGGGLFSGKKGKEIMSLDRPNNRGTKALKVLSSSKGRISFEALADVNPGDVFEVAPKKSFTSGKSVKKGESISVDLPASYNIKKGNIYYRMNDALLQESIKKAFVENEKKVNVSLFFTGRIGEPAELTVRHKESGCEVSVCGETVQRARERGVTPDDIKMRLEKLGGSSFLSDETKVSCDENIFISNGGLNALRREALDKISEKLLNKSKRIKILFDNSKKNDIIGGSVHKNVLLSASVTLGEQLEPVCGCEAIQRVYYPLSLIKDADQAKGVFDRIRQSGKQAYVSLPFFLRQRHLPLFSDMLKVALAASPDGILARSPDQVIAAAAVIKENDFGVKPGIACDYHIYTYNSKAYEFLLRLCNSLGLKLISVAAPIELSGREIAGLAPDIPMELPVYGRLALMVSEHCVRKTLGVCRHDDEPMFFDNDAGDEFFAYCDCTYCNNVIFDSKPLYLYDIASERKQNITGFRLDLTCEGKEESERILRAVSEGGSDIDFAFHRGRYETSIM